MLRSFASEWIKIRRPSVVLGGLSMTFFALLVVPLGIVNATSARAGRFGGELSRAALSSDQGLTTLLSRGATLASVVSLVIVASGMAAEYTQGTLRNLLVRQPDRRRLLAGKFLALLLYAMLAATVALAAGAGAALVTAPARGIDTSAWTSSTGLANLAGMCGNLLLGVVAFCALGLFSALLFRSAAAAVAVPLAYILVIENLLVAVWSDAPRWLFGRAVMAVINGRAILAGGGTSTGYDRGLGLGGIYVALFLVVGGILFIRRDVAA